jgi:dTDP-4-amino-4,6-dideoxygalactose transaminase
MSSALRTMARAVPDWPRRRYNTFTGSNLWTEWLGAWRDLGRRDHTAAAVLRAYEAAFAREAGCRHAFSFGAGRMAFYALLDALGLERGDEVVLPGFTCTVVPNALIYRGLVPVYVDIDPVTFNIDPALIEKALTPRTKALVLQHTFGVSADAASLRRIARAHGLVLIEDAAHSLGARHVGTPHGALGDAAFFSTDRTKVINTHLGGMVTTSDDALARRLAAIQERTPFLQDWCVRRILFTFLAEFLFYHPDMLWVGRPGVSALRRLGLLFYWRDELRNTLPDDYPFPCRLSSSQARIGSSQLAALRQNLDHRRAVARWLEERIGWYQGSTGADVDEQAWLRYSFLVRDREAFLRRFSGRMELMVWFTSVIYCRDSALHEVGYKEGSCPVAEAVARHIVNFPTHPRIPLASIRDLWSANEDWAQDEILRSNDLLASVRNARTLLPAR